MSSIGNEFHLWRPIEAAARLRSWAPSRTPIGRLRSIGHELAAWRGLPSSVPYPLRGVDDAERTRLLADAPAKQTYAVIFTPRSGSSRLQEILAAPRCLGNPGEMFNPGFMPRIAQGFHARDIEDYVAVLRRVRGRRGVMGFEATWRHVQSAFGTAERFGRIVAPDAWVWLIREDIVAQAVSISRMAQTQVSHATPSLAEEAREAAERRFRYSAVDIAARLASLRRLEIGSEGMFAALGVRPLRLSHERILAIPPREAAARVAALVGVEIPPKARFALTHERLGTAKNDDFARRFRAEHAGLVARVERARAPLIEALE